MSGYHIGKQLNKYFTEKYGKNFERARKRYDLIYKLHYIFCVFLIIYIQFINSPFELMLAFEIEIFLFIFLMIHPSYSTIAGIFLPLLGISLDLITYEVLIKMSNTLELSININYLTNMITVILNLVIVTFIILIKIKKWRRSMNIVIIYASRTGNTKIIAESIKEKLQNENIVYFGEATKEIPEADIYFIGSWTDKGNATDEIVEVLKKMKNKKIAYFGTAGYGGSEEYYKKLFEIVKLHIDPSNKILGYFYCQGKMPMQVRARYEKMLSQSPEDDRLKESIENFDIALSHPDDKDVTNAKKWAEDIVSLIRYI